MPEPVREPTPAGSDGGAVTAAEDMQEEQSGPEHEPGGETITTPQQTEEGADREHERPPLSTPGGQTVTSPQELEDAGDA